MVTFLVLSTDEAEALRRSLYGWTLAECDHKALEAISERLGSPTQQAWDRLGCPRETWEKVLAAAGRDRARVTTSVTTCNDESNGAALQRGSEG